MYLFGGGSEAIDKYSLIDNSWESIKLLVEGEQLYDMENMGVFQSNRSQILIFGGKIQQIRQSKAFKMNMESCTIEKNIQLLPIEVEFPQPV